MATTTTTATSSVYEYTMYQASESTTIPADYFPSDADVAAFNFDLRFRHVLHLRYPEPVHIPLNSTSRSFLLPRRLFSSPPDGFDPSTVVEAVLSETGAAGDFIAAIVPEVSSFAVELAKDPSNAGVGVVTLVLALFAVTPFDDREAIDRVLSQQDFRDLRFTPASKSAIDGLKRFTLDSVRKCTVCLDEMLIGDPVACLPCEHVFHGSCIVKWLETSHLCPLCRYAMP
ncbi:E3 ubiquitin-protein ligase RING1-like [Linum grandiflorum]